MQLNRWERKLKVIAQATPQRLLLWDYYKKLRIVDKDKEGMG